MMLSWGGVGVGVRRIVRAGRRIAGGWDGGSGAEEAEEVKSTSSGGRAVNGAGKVDGKRIMMSKVTEEEGG